VSGASGLYQLNWQRMAQASAPEARSADAGVAAPRSVQLGRPSAPMVAGQLSGQDVGGNVAVFPAMLLFANEHTVPPEA
jgi:hypothetical protein